MKQVRDIAIQQLAELIELYTKLLKDLEIDYHLASKANTDQSSQIWGRWLQLTYVIGDLNNTIKEIEKVTK